MSTSNWPPRWWTCDEKTVHDAHLATGRDAAHDGQQFRAPYTADYRFFAPK
ncbi:MAG: hypothetical protein WBV36_02720 [Terriglobales bacterium]